MKFQVHLTASAEEDLRYFRAHERRVVADAILGHLGVDAGTASKRRRRLRPNPLAPWELRVGSYRVFYEIEGDNRVKVVSIGWKEHNTLWVRGRIVEL